MSGAVHRQQHGYKNGHQLLTGSVRLSRADQDLVDRLSDISGPLRPGQLFEPYLTFYPLPSETYYVVAKTWQDRDAPRAGCVMTQSVLVSAQLWADTDGVRQLFAYVAQLKPDSDASREPPESLVQRALPPIVDERLPALVEALFLEDRKPIAVFDPRSADLITERLLLSLWPSARRSFAVCTYALGARKIGGRDFDLVFVPNDARSRFAEWSGRRIDAGMSAAPARHRWTGQIVERIFQAETPSLPITSLPDVLQRGNRNDESVLRLSLLWEELSQRAPSSKTAALGLLDILNSQNVSLRAAPQLQHVLLNAIDVAASSEDGEDAWSFLAALAVKISASEAALFTEPLMLAAEALSRRDPIGSASNVSALRAQNRDIPRPLLRGLGDGLAAPEGIERSSGLQLSFELLISLLASSSAFARAFLSRAALEVPAYATNIAQGISQTDNECRHDLRANILPNLAGPEATEILKALLLNASADEVLAAVGTVSKATHFKQKAFDAPLIEAAIDADVLVAVRDLVMSEDDSTGADRFILRTLKPEEEDVLWLAAQHNTDRRSALAVKFVDHTDHHDLMRLLRHPIARDALLTTLGEDSEASAPALARVLIAGNAPIYQTAEFSLAAWPWIEEVEREQLATRVLERVLREASATDWSMTDRFFAVAASSISPRQLVQFAVPTNASASLVGHNIVLIDGEKQISKAVSGVLPDLTERLIRRFDNLGPSAYAAWARLLSNADLRANSTIHAAAAAFEYAIQLTRLPISPLVVTAFPMFYRHLPTKKDVGLFWTEIDRRKSARRLLVEAFMKSNWPAADLIVTALEADIADKVVGRISRGYRAEAYVSMITNDAERLEPRLRKAVHKALQSEFDLDY